MHRICPAAASPTRPPAWLSTDAAKAVADLAADLRLRQIDVLGFRFGAEAAMTLAAARPSLVRRLVLVGVPPIDRLPLIPQQTLVLRVKLGIADDSQWSKGILARAKFVDLGEYGADLFEAAPKALARQIAGFLALKP